MLLPISAAQMDLLSGHHYTERKFKAPFTPEDAAKYEEAFPTYSASVMEGVRRLVDGLPATAGRRQPRA